MFLTNEDVRAKLPPACMQRQIGLRLSDKKKTTLELEPEHRDVHGTMVTTVRLISLYTAVITTLDSGAKFAAIISFPFCQLIQAAT